MRGTCAFLSTPSARRATFKVLPQKSCRHKISIHALREEGDTSSPTQIQHITIFLSTPSARRATVSRRRCLRFHLYFYPRPPRGGRLVMRMIASVSTLFLSTPSARRATSMLSAYFATSFISIHALREEGDAFGSLSSSEFRYFYPRPPRGGRLQDVVNFIQLFKFLSTPSARRATAKTEKASPLLIKV